MITIRETKETDLHNLQALWADGNVMRFVGFPNGLQQSDEDMKNWYMRTESARPNSNHYCIFDGDIYCGESCYGIDPDHNYCSGLQDYG